MWQNLTCINYLLQVKICILVKREILILTPPPSHTEDEQHMFGFGLHVHDRRRNDVVSTSLDIANREGESTVIS